MDPEFKAKAWSTHSTKRRSIHDPSQKLAACICLPSHTLCLLINPSISAVSETLPTEENAIWIDTNDIIFPGFIDLHNHLMYAMLNLWDAGNCSITVTSGARSRSTSRKCDARSEHTSLPEECYAVAVLPPENSSGRDEVLVSGEKTVWRYAMR